METSSDEVTRLLQDWGQWQSAGSRETAASDLQRIASAWLHRSLRRERPGHTLQTTALVHEAYLKLIDQKDTRWQNREHFFAIAAQAMRRLLIDSARNHTAAKRGGVGREPAAGRGCRISRFEPDPILLPLDEALKTLGKV